MKLIKFNVLFVLLLLLIIPFLLSFKLHTLPDRLQPGLKGTERIYKDHILSQGFLSNSDNLSGVGLSIKNPNFSNKNELVYLIKDSDGNTVRIGSINGRNIPDGDFIVLKFEPVTNSKNRQFYFELSSPTSPENESFEVYFSEEDNFAEQKLKTDGRPTNLNLAYVIYYTQNSQVLVFLNVAELFVSRFFRDTTFFVFYTLLIASTIILLIKQPGRKSS